MKTKFDPESGLYAWFDNDIEIEIGRIKRLDKTYMPYKWNCTRYDVPEVSIWNNSGFFSKNVEDYVVAHFMLLNGWDKNIFERKHFDFEFGNVTLTIFGCNDCVFIKTIRPTYSICTIQPFISVCDCSGHIHDFLSKGCPFRNKISCHFSKKYTQ